MMIHGFLLIVTVLSWVSECQTIINRELVYHNDKYLNELMFSIPQGIQLANVINELDRTDQENLDRCALAVAVSKFESSFNPLARNGTCLGMFQIKPSTASDIVKDLSFLRDKRLKSELYNPTTSVCLFSLLIDDFTEKYHTTFGALVRYNNSQKISQRIMKYYKGIK